MKEPKTIRGWLRAHETAKNKGVEFSAGTLMPIVGNTDHLIPAGKSHLFSVRAARVGEVINENNTSRWTGRGWRTVSHGKHILYVVSVAVFSGNKLEWLCGPSGVVKKFVLPEGWAWGKDQYGIFAADAGGVDFHPVWTSEISVKQILTGHAENKSRRLAQIEREKIEKQNEEIFQRDLRSTRVTLDDSRRAGNCVEGTLAFAESRLGISREQILNAGYLFHVSARRIIATCEPRALLAAKVAWQRETMVSI